jgi:hypothetical protein
LGADPQLPSGLRGETAPHSPSVFRFVALDGITATTDLLAALSTVDLVAKPPNVRARFLLKYSAMSGYGQDVKAVGGFDIELVAATTHDLRSAPVQRRPSLDRPSCSIASSTLHRRLDAPPNRCRWHGTAFQKSDAQTTTKSSPGICPALGVSYARRSRVEWHSAPASR